MEAKRRNGIRMLFAPVRPLGRRGKCDLKSATLREMTHKWSLAVFNTPVLLHVSLVQIRSQKYDRGILFNGVQFI